MAKYDIIIPHYNHPDVLALAASCLKSIRKYSRDYRVIWVQNGGQVPRDLNHHFTRAEAVQIIKLPSNQGFIKATNAGLRASDAPYVVMMNNDTQAAPNWLPMLSAALTKNVGIAGPRTTTSRSWQGKIGRNPGTIQILSRDMMLAFFCAMMRRDVLETVGYLNEDYGVGLGDDDEYCRRVHTAGFRLALVHDLVIPHNHRTTFSALYSPAEITNMQSAAMSRLMSTAPGAGPPAPTPIISLTAGPPEQVRGDGAETKHFDPHPEPEREMRGIRPMQYELTASALRFMLGITHNGVRREVVATMKPYDNGKLIQLLKEREAALVDSNTDADALDFKAGGAAEANREFFDAHKISVTLDGVEASDAIIDKLDALYKIRTMVITVGYLGAKDAPEQDAETGKVLDLEAEFGDEIIKRHTFALVDDAGKERSIDIAQVIRFATAEDRIRWDRAQKLQTLKEGGRRIRYNYEAIGHLYDAMVKEARGFTLNGQPCVESNKPDWIKLIPYIFKFRAMDSTFALAQAKNG
jgi:hypothetical protein